MTSHVSLLSTSTLLLVNLSSLVHAWRWPSATQTARSFSDLLRIKDRTPKTIYGSHQKQQNGATTKHLWSSLGANQGPVGLMTHNMRSRGLDVNSPYSPYGLIHKVINTEQPSNSLLLRCYGTVGDRGNQFITVLGIFSVVRSSKF